MSVPDEWDFYLCRLDDEPTSIFLNLGYGNRAPLADAPVLYWVFIELLEPGEHGMGTQAEAERLQRLEYRIVAEAKAAGLSYVGRVRGGADWQLSFYGAAELKPALANAVEQALAGSGRRFQIGAHPDPGWTYYLGVLWPNSERRRWMGDRKVVESLLSHGDTLQHPRRVDHCLYFETEAAAEAFAVAAGEHGFELERRTKTALEGARTWRVELSRTDPVELEAIHEVVMLLCRLAEQHGGGEYDGWGAAVVKANSG